ncbi:hypothetical protein [Terrihabitans rhizophilus]|jgi:hypothetical protein|uniref:Uncharacterized protein n=1 Tax=Terrihabitans rhizophilus TaxID=3092662 RepID=A0ABU4RNG8_9HYPH|nr:hypothetical protein [Terrihabitans sp. PJ23]MDX6805200.1 hypothetical protein [Terrihabitans sp. PJ23]
MTTTTKTPLFAWVLLAASLGTFFLAFQTFQSGSALQNAAPGVEQTTKPAP